VTLPAPFDEAAARGMADRIVEGNATYDTDQVIDDILFVDGDVRFRANVNGTGTVIASGSILFDNVTVGHPMFLAPSTRLSFSAFADITSGKERLLRGVLVAGRDIVSDKTADVTGVLIAGRKIWIHQDSRLTKLILDRFPPQVAITSPIDGAFVKTPRLQVTGTVTDDGVIAGVTVNGVAATVSGGYFTAEVDLAEGTDTLVARAVDSTDKEGVAAVTVTLDTQRPNLILDAPQPRGSSRIRRPPGWPALRRISTVSSGWRSTALPSRSPAAGSRVRWHWWKD
jgi:hypothetical protein